MDAKPEPLFYEFQCDSECRLVASRYAPRALYAYEVDLNEAAYQYARRVVNAVLPGQFKSGIVLNAIAMGYVRGVQAARADANWFYMI